MVAVEIYFRDTIRYQDDLPCISDVWPWRVEKGNKGDCQVSGLSYWVDNDAS